MVVDGVGVYVGSEEWSFADKKTGSLIQGCSALFVQPGATASLRVSLPKDFKG